MNLAARLARGAGPRPAAPAAAKPAPARSAAFQSEPAAVEPVAATQADQYYEIKTRLHSRLIDLLDLTMIGSLPEAEMRAEIARAVETILREEFKSAPLNQVERRSQIGRAHV